MAELADGGSAIIDSCNLEIPRGPTSHRTVAHKRGQFRQSLLLAVAFTSDILADLCRSEIHVICRLLSLSRKAKRGLEGLPVVERAQKLH